MQKHRFYLISAFKEEKNQIKQMIKEKLKMRGLNLCNFFSSRLESELLKIDLFGFESHNKKQTKKKSSFFYHNLIVSWS